MGLDEILKNMCFIEKSFIKFSARRLKDGRKDDILCDKIKRYKEIYWIENREVRRDFDAVWNFVYDGVAYSWRRSLWGNPGFDKYMRAIDTTSKAGSVSILRWWYTPDKGDKWQTPEETYERRNLVGQFMGDCEDIARFLLCGLNRNGHNAYMYVMWNNESGHATCAVEEKGTIETIGTFFRINHFTTSRKEVAEYWYPDLKGMVIYEQDPFTFELKKVEFIKGDGKEGKAFKLKKLEYLVSKIEKVDKDFRKYVDETINGNIGQYPKNY